MQTKDRLAEARPPAAAPSVAGLPVACYILTARLAAPTNICDSPPIFAVVRRPVLLPSFLAALTVAALKLRPSPLSPSQPLSQVRLRPAQIGPFPYPKPVPSALAVLGPYPGQRQQTRLVLPITTNAVNT